MSKVKIQTLTPIHIGSGEFLRNNSDFVEYKHGGNSYISIIDPKKLLEIIGLEHINDWVAMIERNGNTKEYVSRMGKNATPDRYALRILNNFANSLKPWETLKECIHDGLGKPYIPGSSIKGAIRTAVLTTIAEQQSNLENFIKNYKGDVSAKQIEARLFGDNPNSDVFRFIKVGDAYFDSGSELSTRVINLNIRQKENLIDPSKPQLVEAIGVENETEFQIKVDKSYYEWAKNHWPLDDKNVKPIGAFPAQLDDISCLFSLINEHSRKLVDDEISYWKEVVANGFSGAEDYIENMEQIMDEISSCQKGTECVLRIGHASGWRFITGAWAEKLQNFERDIIPASRPRNHIYKEYDFPKSRRLDEDGDIFGFVKLSIL